MNDMYSRDEHTNGFKSTCQNASYYKPDRTWNDYEPAYRYGYDRYGELRGRQWSEVENDLEAGWENAKAKSRLAWSEAKDAVRDCWHKLERAMPGDADHDGR